jgi:transcriptional regulator with XRE-family HTH domain
MDDFAAVLLAARARAGLTQAELATAAGLTPSYLSFIENRKKPPPSDEVCRRLAEVLDIPAKDLVDVAHLERAPEPLRKRVRSLTHSLKRERHSRKRLLETLLSPFLFGGPPGFSESAFDTLSISSARRRRIRDVFKAVGRKHADRERQVSKLVDQLPERERQALLAALAKLLKNDDRKQREPPHFYSAPRGDKIPRTPYRFTTDRGGLDGEVRARDILIVDPAKPAEPGDLVLVAGEGQIKRLEKIGDRFVLQGAADGTFPEEMTQKELDEWLARRCAGVVIEIRRSLRPPGA